MSDFDRHDETAQPVVGPLTDAELRATPVPVSGTVSVTQPVAVTDNSGSLTVDGTVAVTQPVAVTDNSGSLTVDGSVAITNFPASQPVDDGGGSLTVDGAVAVSNFPSVQPVSDNFGSLTVDGPLTDAELRASPPSVKVSDGTYTVSVLPVTAAHTGTEKALIVDAQLHAAAGDGTAHHVTMDTSGSLNVAFGEGANLDGFSRLRVSNPDTVFDSVFQYSLLPLLYETVTANGGTVTHSANDSSAVLALNGTANGSVTLQSKAYVRYLPGKSQLVLMSGVMGAAVAGVVKRAGYFDDNDGVFFEQNGTTDYAFTIRTSTSGSPSDANRIPQSSWNLDKMDGTGISGINLDLTKNYILVFEFQWLGMGRVRVGFDVDGRIHFVHEFHNAGALTTVYMKTGSLPIRWKMTGGTASSMMATCSSVQSEGGNDKFFSYHFAYNTAVISAGNGTQTYAFSVRPKSTFNSITNRMKIDLESLSGLVTGNYSVLVEVYYGTTVGGAPSWTDMNASYSGLQVDTAGTPSGGTKITSFYIAANNQSISSVIKPFSARYPLVMDVAGTGYTNITVYVTAYGGASTCYLGLAWDETR